MKSERSLEAVDPDMNSSVLFPFKLNLISGLFSINFSYVSGSGLSDPPKNFEQFESFSFESEDIRVLKLKMFVRSSVVLSTLLFRIICLDVPTCQCP